MAHHKEGEEGDKPTGKPTQTPFTKKPPSTSLRLGGVNVAIFRNQGAHGAYHSATIKRSYFDKSSNSFKETHSFDLAALVSLRACIDQAINYMSEDMLVKPQGASTSTKTPTVRHNQLPTTGDSALDDFYADGTPSPDGEIPF